jgi:hypothetical protein
MDAKKDAKGDLVNIRSKLVELRRSLATYGLKNDIENAAARISEVQANIEAIDRAIADEVELNRSPMTIKNIG